MLFLSSKFLWFNEKNTNDNNFPMLRFLYHFHVRNRTALRERSAERRLCKWSIAQHSNTNTKHRGAHRVLNTRIPCLYKVVPLFVALKIKFTYTPLKQYKVMQVSINKGMRHLWGLKESEHFTKNKSQT